MSKLESMADELYQALKEARNLLDFALTRSEPSSAQATVERILSSVDHVLDKARRTE